VVSEEEKTYTEAEAHRFFAIDYNGKTWDLLDKADRTADDDELMVHSAHASCRHWLVAGTGVNHQRGEWLIARVYTVLGLGEAALRHAERTLQLTEKYSSEMEDFDVAFAYEGVARAHAAAGNKSEAAGFVERATKAGEAIEDAGNREYFFGDMNGGEWFGVR
jgi:hypothetical protein